MFVRFITAIAIACSSLVAQAAVDVNKASRSELEALPGVGPALSGKIAEARKSGEFRDWNDLVGRVKGVGPASATRLSQAGLTVSGVAYTTGGKGSAEAAPKAARTPREGKPIALGSQGEAAPISPRAKAAEGSR